MGAQVAYNYATWIANYPEFAACSSAQGQAWFNRAGLFWANDGSGLESNPTIQEQLMYMLTSHLAWLNAPRDPNGNPAATGQPAPAVVGRISSASEGSVSVSTEWAGSGSPSAAWFIQTKYGAMYWQATAGYRTFRYAAQPTIVPTGAFPGPYGFGRGRGCIWR